MITETIQTNEVVAGDTILIDGDMVTVSANFIKHSTFLGTTIMGCSFAKNGYKVERAS